jgi:BNR repeat-like domain
MHIPTRRRLWRAGIAAAAVVAAGAVVLGSGKASGAHAEVVPVSSDPFANASSEHATEADPDTYAYGRVIVSAFMQGLFPDDEGASGIGFATSADGGRSWIHGSLPGITTYTGGPFSRVVFPAVAYDRRDRTWVISALAGAIDPASPVGPPARMAVLVSRSANGGRTWSDPVTATQVARPVTLDKPSIACDNGVASRYYGNCYMAWERHGAAGKLMQMSTSADGGKTWGAAKDTANNSTGSGGQPLVRPDGTVVVPVNNWPNLSQILSFESHNGGRTWGPARMIAHATATADPGNLVSNLFSGPLVSAAEDGAGKIYVAWQDCRFRPHCSANDIVMTTSTNGGTWTPVSRVTSGPDDSTLPGIGLDPLSSGVSARIGITYYSFPDPRCQPARCMIEPRFISSADGGLTWSRPAWMAPPIPVAWLARVAGADPAQQDAMLSDYLTTSVIPRGNAVAVFPLAAPPSGITFRQAMYAVAGGMPIRN